MARHLDSHQGMASLVIGGHLAFVIGHHHRAPLGAHQHLVLGRLELGHGHHAPANAGGQKRRLVDQVGEIGARESRRAARDHARVHVGRQRHLFHVNLENLLAAQDVRVRHHDLAVEAAGAQQRRIQHVRPVGRRDQDHALGRIEAVHFDQQLVQGLLALIIAAAQAGAAMTADRVDLVDENDARRVLLALLEHVAHAARPDTDEHLDEVGT